MRIQLRHAPTQSVIARENVWSFSFAVSRSMSSADSSGQSLATHEAISAVTEKSFGAFFVGRAIFGSGGGAGVGVGAAALSPPVPSGTGWVLGIGYWVVRVVFDSVGAVFDAC